MEKIEIRSRTGRFYRRGGVLWGTDWSEPVDAKSFKEEDLKAIMEDPHLEKRVDGRRQTKATEASAADSEALAAAKQMLDEAAAYAAEADKEIQHLRDTLSKQAAESQEAIVRLQLEARDAVTAQQEELAALRARIASLESAPTQPSPETEKGETKPEGKSDKKTDSKSEKK